MRVGILTLKAGTQAGGLATYESCLIHAIAALDQDNEYHILCVHPVERAHFQIDQPNFHFHELAPRIRLVNMLLSVPRAIRKLDVNFFHVMYLPPLTLPKPFVFTAHGPEMFIDPKFFPLRIRLLLLPLTRRCYRRASSILCASGATREYLIRAYPEAAERSRVVYNGCHDAFKPSSDVEPAQALRDRFDFKSPYVLAVGRIEPRKNPIRLLEAYALFRERTQGAVKLVIAGGETWSKGEARDAINRLGIASDVALLGYVQDAQLPMLYSRARMFVFPSLWEGFGLPLIEAMRCGCPTITSNVSCLPEVAGGAALLVDPLSPDSIAAAMTQVHEDETLRADLRARGLTRSSEFSWERCARETIQAYKELETQRAGAMRS